MKIYKYNYQGLTFPHIQSPSNLLEIDRTIDRLKKELSQTENKNEVLRNENKYLNEKLDELSILLKKKHG